jgi:hypothetical protein
MRQIYETIDRQNFQWIVVLVAGLGFFLDGYTVRYPHLPRGILLLEMSYDAYKTSTNTRHSYLPVIWPYR